MEPINSHNESVRASEIESAGAFPRAEQSQPNSWGEADDGGRGGLFRVHCAVNVSFVCDAPVGHRGDCAGFHREDSPVT